MPSDNDWSSSGDDSERKLEDNKHAGTETPEDSLHLEWWEEAERKAEEEEEEEEEMLEEQRALMESSATACKEERTRGPCGRPPRRGLSTWTWLRIILPAVSHQNIRRGCADLEGAMPLRARHHNLRKVKPPPPTSSLSPQTMRREVLRESIAS
jgi:hypothetical protein